MSNSNAIVLSITTLQTVVAGKFKSSFAVVDAEGNLVGSKAHATQAEAEVELGSLKFYTVGLEFARATAKEGVTDKALVGKANIVASYLMFAEQQEQELLKADEAPVVEDEAPVVEDAPKVEEF